MRHPGTQPKFQPDIVRTCAGSQRSFRALSGSRGGAVALATIRRIISDVVRDELAETADKNSSDSIPRELIVQFVVGAYMAVLTWWLDKGAKLPPAKIDAMFRRLASEGIKSLYSRPPQV